MIRITAKLSRNATYDGHSATRPAHSPWSTCGTRISRISSVIAIANTPSLNASTRVGFSATTGNYVGEGGADVGTVVVNAICKRSIVRMTTNAMMVATI